MSAFMNIIKEVVDKEKKDEKTGNIDSKNLSTIWGLDLSRIQSLNLESSPRNSWFLDLESAEAFSPGTIQKSPQLRRKNVEVNTASVFINRLNGMTLKDSPSNQHDHVVEETKPQPPKHTPQKTFTPTTPPSTIIVTAEDFDSEDDVEIEVITMEKNRVRTIADIFENNDTSDQQLFKKIVHKRKKKIKQVSLSPPILDSIDAQDDGNESVTNEVVHMLPMIPAKEKSSTKVEKEVKPKTPKPAPLKSFTPSSQPLISASNKKVSIKKEIVKVEVPKNIPLTPFTSSSEVKPLAPNLTPIKSFTPTLRTLISASNEDLPIKKEKLKVEVLKSIPLTPLTSSSEVKPLAPNLTPILQPLISASNKEVAIKKEKVKVETPKAIPLSPLTLSSEVKPLAPNLTPIKSFTPTLQPLVRASNEELPTKKEKVKVELLKSIPLTPLTTSSEVKPLAPNLTPFKQSIMATKDKIPVKKQDAKQKLSKPTAVKLFTLSNLPSLPRKTTTTTTITTTNKEASITVEEDVTSQAPKYTPLKTCDTPSFKPSMTVFKKIKKERQTTPQKPFTPSLRPSILANNEEVSMKEEYVTSKAPHASSLPTFTPSFQLPITAIDRKYPSKKTPSITATKENISTKVEELKLDIAIPPPRQFSTPSFQPRITATEEISVEQQEDILKAPIPTPNPYFTPSFQSSVSSTNDEVSIEKVTLQSLKLSNPSFQPPITATKEEIPIKRKKEKNAKPQSSTSVLLKPSTPSAQSSAAVISEEVSIIVDEEVISQLPITPLQYFTPSTVPSTVTANRKEISITMEQEVKSQKPKPTPLKSPSKTPPLTGSTFPSNFITSAETTTKIVNLKTEFFDEEVINKEPRWWDMLSFFSFKSKKKPVKTSIVKVELPDTKYPKVSVEAKSKKKSKLEIVANIKGKDDPVVTKSILKAEFSDTKYRKERKRNKEIAFNITSEKNHVMNIKELSEDVELHQNVREVVVKNNAEPKVMTEKEKGELACVLLGLLEEAELPLKFYEMIGKSNQFKSMIRHLLEVGDNKDQLMEMYSPSGDENEDGASGLDIEFNIAKCFFKTAKANGEI